MKKEKALFFACGVEGNVGFHLGITRGSANTLFGV